jgi:hypothetical protein
MDNGRMQVRTYRYRTNELLFPFGYGLSYSRFQSADIALSSALSGKTNNQFN